MEPPEIRLDTATNRVAIRTGLADPRVWFIFNTESGGHYATGGRAPDDPSGWLPYTPPEVDTTQDQEG